MRRLLPLILIGLATSAAAQPNLVEVRSWAEVSKAFSPDTRIRVVNLWATWCLPCVAEMADLQKIDDTFKNDEVDVVGISLDDAIPGKRAERKILVREFLLKRKIRFKTVYWTASMPKIMDEYDFGGEIPVTFVFDQKGKELMRHQGVINREIFVADLKRLLKVVSSQQSAVSRKEKG